MPSRGLERLRLEFPIVQAPLGGKISSPELASAVSNAGGLGMIGMRAPATITTDFARARSLAPGKPLGIGLLMPFTRRAHVDATIAAKPDAVVLMAGFAPAIVEKLRAQGIIVIHQVGSRDDGQRALCDGADALIAQGVEAGGHVLGDQPGHSLLRELLAIAGERPVLLSGGIATADDVRRALAQGAAAVVAGTRYLLTHEAHAHPAYKQRILGAERTVLTTLFGIGWSLKHRVVPNRATERFCDERGGIAPWVIRVQRAVEPLIAPFGALHDPSGRAARTFNLVPLFTPVVPRPEQPARAVEYTALYAGESAKRIHSIERAFDVTRELGSGARAQ
jgi:NAD(P)H-dependent flavin oxidoreductase YrpB (nitropropane dioxygenase family)